MEQDYIMGNRLIPSVMTVITTMDHQRSRTEITKLHFN
jgi:hypothetical protein